MTAAADVPVPRDDLITSQMPNGATRCRAYRGRISRPGRRAARRKKRRRYRDILDFGREKE